jgi:LysR family transcriptional regulator, hca operon transcriptional activator
MDLRYLRYFIAVAEERSFTRAAERLNTVQPSLSQQIKKLEEVYVGTPLLRRDKHHVELTEAGRVFLTEARSILESVDRAIALVRKTAKAEAGRLTIGFVPGAEGAVFAHLLPLLRKRHPELVLTLRSLSTPDQIEALCNRAIDIGFLRGPVEVRSLMTEVVLDEEIVAVLPARHELAALDPIPPAALAGQPFVQVTRSGAPAVHDAAAQIADRAGLHLEPALETDNVLGTLNAVGSGMGFSLVPGYVRQICPPSVVVRSLEMHPQPRIELLAAFPRENQTAALVEFLSLMRSWIAQGRPETA